MHVGEFYASACALSWAFAVILFRRAGETVPPLAMNLFRVTLSSVLFLVTLRVLGQDLWGRAPLRDYLILMASGVIAIGLSDTLFHMCLNRVGAGINALVDTLYSPFIILFAFLMLGERLGTWQWVGMALIIVSVVVATRAAPPPGTTRRTMVAGVVFGVLSMATLGFGIVLAKPVLERSDVVWATTVRQLGSWLVLAPTVLLLPGRRRNWAVFRPSRAWRFSLPGTLIGSYVALLLWIAGMKHTAASTAAILNQTSTIYVLVLASLLLHEPFGWRRALAAALALTGVVCVLRP